MAQGKNPYKHFGSKFPGPYMPRGKNPPLLPPGAARKKPKLPKLPGGPVGDVAHCEHGEHWWKPGRSHGVRAVVFSGNAERERSAADHDGRGPGT